MDKKFFTTNEAALILGISRQAVFKKIKAGQIKAQKADRYLLIKKKDLAEAVGNILSREIKQEIKKAVGKIIDKYEKMPGLLDED